MTAPCSAAWQDHLLPYAHHCGLDAGHEGLHRCMACTQLPAGQVDTGNRVGGDGAAWPELVTAECGPFWAHEDCDDPGCTCHCHAIAAARDEAVQRFRETVVGLESGGSGR